MTIVLRLAARVLLYAPSHRQDSTYHSLYTSRGARETAQSVRRDRIDDVPKDIWVWRWGWGWWGMGVFICGGGGVGMLYGS